MSFTLGNPYANLNINPYSIMSQQIMHMFYIHVRILSWINMMISPNRNRYLERKANFNTIIIDFEVRFLKIMPL